MTALKPEGSGWDKAFSDHALPVEVARAEGVFIYDTQGRRYYDASGGPFAVNMGHGHPRLTEAVRSQLDSYCYVHPMLANRRRADLCEKVAEVAPEGFNATYLVSGGSEAVETALKIARQYHVARGAVGKHKIVSCYESYHGMTLATMSLSGNPGTTRHYDPMTFQWPKIAQYSDYQKPAHLTRDEWGVQSARELDRVIQFHGAHVIAAFIATPHGCGPDYGVVPPDSYWSEIRRICDDNDVLFISDEVVTGFGRTGQWFGMDHYSVKPDIIVVAKGFSSCYVPLGGVIVSDRVNAPYREGAAFVHGFTNGGNALACAVGCAVIDTIREDHLLQAVRDHSARLFSWRERLLAHPSVADVRGWGLFMVMELVNPSAHGRAFFAPEQEAEHKFQRAALDNGVALYSTLYGQRRRPVLERGLPMWIAPAFVISDDELSDMMERIDRTLGQWEDRLGVMA
ncbi:aminotransferase class III-fold pyridoxal phosphate-dependent enzyme [Brevundimonas diminuta]|uniref:aminotransferase family protein n=1 Tax=Brevundimonas diminuta TaxID=293 RepID=UPI002096D63F|nr:aminotransferase class III-fold pyridoxal phosphate-dependent enzyme [Brevundimonas diminuta]MCO8017870.1 aminotransferase class III-fold pyridoxal phosphate-dependent enzyme [Brevundimonas diminuta]MCO8021390.1 aminotransferase class III-fold pyridoxal phosphate-dependent enzyme [Brevundimonas diminuta]